MDLVDDEVGCYGEGKEAHVRMTSGGNWDDKIRAWLGVDEADGW